MRKLVFLLAILLAGSSGQSAQIKPVEPQVLGVVFILDSSNGTLRPLAEENWKVHGKRTGWAGATGLIELPGEHSAVRIASGNRNEFVFNVGRPEDMKLYMSIPKKNQRIFEIVKVSGGGRTREPIPGVPVEITKYGESSFGLTPVAPLVPGEYAIVYDDKVMSFGVDG